MDTGLRSNLYHLARMVVAQKLPETPEVPAAASKMLRAGILNPIQRAP